MMKMCYGVWKVVGLFLLLEAILFAFLYLTFFHEYEIGLRTLSSGFVSLALTSFIWAVILLLIHREETQYETMELIQVQV